MTVTSLAQHAVVPATNSTTNPVVSPVISIGDNNALNIQITVLSGGGASNSLVANVWGSNDMENWLNTGLSATTVTVAATGAGIVGSGQITAFGYAYARLVYTTGGTPALTVIAVEANSYKH